MKMTSLLFLATVFLFSCKEGNSQQQKTRQVGGRCEGCEAIHESPVPFEKLQPVDTLPDFHDKGERIEISGIVYKADGKTPAKDVVIYVYHTDQSGVYPKKGDETGWAQRHGFIRGWMKTNEKGEYRFYTLRPASYPNSSNPQHIHITIKEPGLNEYWIDDYHFSDDPLLTADARRNESKRAGSGIIQLRKEKEMSVGKRDIFLGQNIPGY